jgi:hypothetical protein
MPTANIWRVTITRLDSVPHSSQPRRGDIIETARCRPPDARQRLLIYVKEQALRSKV